MTAVIKKQNVWYCHCNPNCMFIPIMPGGQCGFCRAVEWKMPANVVELAKWRKEKSK